MKFDKIRQDSRTWNHIGMHSVESDRIDRDPTIGENGVLILCLILIKLKSVIFGI
jgi:hypothetical protein